MIIMIKQGLRLRKKDDEEERRESGDPLLPESKRRSHHGRSSVASSVWLVVGAVATLLMILSVFMTSKGSLVINPSRSSRLDSPDTLNFADGLLRLHVPGLDGDRNTLALTTAREGGGGGRPPWTLQACPGTHGTRCPDSSRFPLHVQVRRGSYVHAARWEAADATPLCGGGKAWQMTHVPPPTTTGGTGGDDTMTIEMNWFQSACLHGHRVEPWTATVELTLRRPEEEPPSELLVRPVEDPLFVTKSAWRATRDLKDGTALPPYLFTPMVSNNQPDVTKRLTADKGAFVLPDAVVKPDPGYGKFGELGNYELLCFFGNQTMADVRSSFLQIRPQIFKNQRPFKFHYYDMADLQHPDRYWDEENKKRLRKCKHVLVNLEEYVRPLSQKEYEEQMINFVGHLIRLTKDDTFPIRIFTWTESAVETKNCHSPYLPWTNDHPCNDVLHKLFQQKVFPSRVKLLDNSPLTLPYFGKDAVAVLRPYLLAVIALRVFVITGEQVAAWRQAGQMGKQNGLHRNGKVEPNFELVPYEHWGEALQPVYGLPVA